MNEKLQAELIAKEHELNEREATIASQSRQLEVIQSMRSLVVSLLKILS